MNQTPDRFLVDWLADGPDRGPGHGLDRALAATRRTNQRPGWTFASTWLPGRLAERSTTVPRSFAILVAAVLLAVALVTAVLLVGSARRAAPPFGLASKGNIVLDVDGSLYEANPDGSDPHPFAAKTLGFAYSPVFSPDGTKVAYLTQPAERAPKSIFVANADGTGAHNVTGDTAIITSPLGAPVWSPDGARIAFASTSDDGTNRIYTVGADGSGLTAITGPDASREAPAFSPDGSRLLYLHRAATILNPDDPSERVEIPAGFADCAATWAPDATEILGFGRSCTQLFRIPVSNPTTATKVDLPPGLINMASWRRTAP